MKKFKKVTRTADGIISTILERLDHVNSEPKPDYNRAKASSMAIRDLVSFSRLRLDAHKYQEQLGKKAIGADKSVTGLEFLK